MRRQVKDLDTWVWPSWVTRRVHTESSLKVHWIICSFVSTQMCIWLFTSRPHTVIKNHAICHMSGKDGVPIGKLLLISCLMLTFLMDMQCKLFYWKKLSPLAAWSCTDCEVLLFLHKLDAMPEVRCTTRYREQISMAKLTKLWCPCSRQLSPCTSVSTRQSKQNPPFCELCS